MNAEDEGRRLPVGDPVSYRVIGVKADGTRVLIDDGLSHARARHVRFMLLFAGAFPEVEVERE